MTGCLNLKYYKWTILHKRHELQSLKINLTTGTTNKHVTTLYECGNCLSSQQKK